MNSSEQAKLLLSRQLLKTFPEDAAQALERLAPEDIAQVLAEEEPGVAAKITQALVTPIARAVFSKLSPASAAAIAAQMPVPWAASRLRTLPAEGLEEVFRTMPAGFGKAVRRSMHYSPQTVGSLMDSTALSLPPDARADFALAQIRERGEPTIDGVFVVGRNGRFVGAVRVAGLVAAEATATLETLVDTTIPSLEADSDAKHLAAHSGWAQWRTLPVVDGEANFQGALSYHTIQSLLLEVPTSSRSRAALPLAMAELFWVGLIGITDGLGRTVAAKGESDER